MIPSQKWRQTYLFCCKALRCQHLIWQWKQSKFLLPTKLWRNPVAADSKRPWIMSLAFPIEPFLNIPVRRSWEASRRQHKVPKSLSVQAVPAWLLVSMWTVFVSVATSVCCDLNGKKMTIFSSMFSVFSRAGCTFFKYQSFEFHWGNSKTKNAEKFWNPLSFSLFLNQEKKSLANAKWQMWVCQPALAESSD